MTANAERNRSQVGFGCAHLMRLPERKDRLRVLDEAFEQGIRHYDVARSYGLGATEAELGRFVRDKRGEVVIATKFGLPLSPLARLARYAQRPIRAAMTRVPHAKAAASRTPGSHTSRFQFDPHAAKTSLQTSMWQLGVDYVDIFFLHDPIKGRFDSDDVAALITELLAAGHIRSWGVAGEPAAMEDVLSELERTQLVLQTRADALVDPAPAVVRDADITYGVLVSALPAILEHLQASPEARRRWHEETGIDCGNAQELSVLLLEQALRARQGRVVLMSTTRRDRVLNARLAAERAAGGSGEACARLRALMTAELGSRT